MPPVVAVILTCVLLAVRAAAVQLPPDCPEGARGFALVEIIANARPVVGATVLFTSPSWDSAISQSSSIDGTAVVPCVPVAEGFTASVFAKGYEAEHFSLNASEHPRVNRVVLHPGSGTYVRVTHRGAPISGVIVVFAEVGAAPQEVETDWSGIARYPAMSGPGDAEIKVSIAGFEPQAITVPALLKNGPVHVELPIPPVCTGAIVVR